MSIEKTKRGEKNRKRTEKEKDSYTVFAHIYAHIARAPIVVRCKTRYKDFLALK